ncbi:MAG: hypothetical protein ACKVS9_03345 [Phycisphaerae bacterium]
MLHSRSDRRATRRGLFWVFAHSALLFATTTTFGQTCPNRWTPDLFPGRPGFSGPAYCALDFDDGTGTGTQLYVGGGFEYSGGFRANNVIRWNGSELSPVGAGFNNEIYDLAVYDDGSGPKLYACGSNYSSNGVPVGFIARWNGTTWESVGGGLTHFANCMEVQDFGDGPKLFVGGSFANAGGAPAQRIAMWDGQSWHALGSGVSGGSVVRSLLAVNDADGPGLIVGGTFTQAGTQTNVGHIARWTGEAWTRLGNGVADSDDTPEVNALRMFDDGSGPRLYVGGYFDLAGGVTAGSIARWDGESWSGVGGGLSESFSQAAVYALDVFDDGNGPKLFAGGLFYLARQWRFVARLNGGSWEPVSSGITNTVVGLVTRPSSSGARLTAVGLSGVREMTGTSWTPVLPGGGGSISALSPGTIGGSNALYAGGTFTTLHGVAANRIAQWDGNAWFPLGSGVNGDVTALAHYSESGGSSQLIVGGGFTEAGGVPANRIARWDGTNWLAMDQGFSSPVRTIRVWHRSAGDRLFAGGAFFASPAGHIAVWDGASWQPLGTGLNDTVNEMVVHDDGNGEMLYVAGRFTTAGGQPASRIARWDGASWSPVGAGLSAEVYDLAVFDDGNGPQLYAVGQFQTSGGVFVDNFAKWDGANWTGVGGGTDANTDRLFVHDFGGGPRLVVSGRFSTVGEQRIRTIAVWDGQAWSSVAGDVDGNFLAYATYDDGRGPALFAAGTLQAVDDIISGNIARYGRPAPIVGDVDDDCTVGLTDLALLLRAFGLCSADAGFDPTADIVADGCIDLADLALLLSRFGLSA